jgi:hypothetical protein
MRLVAANLQPFNLGEFTAAPGMLSALYRWSGVILSSPLQLNDKIIAEIQTTARTEQAARTRSSLALSNAPFAFAMERLRKRLGKP